MSAERARWLRAQGSKLKRMAEDLFDAADVLEREVSDRPILKGKDLADHAVAVLLCEVNEEMHYKQLLTRIEDESGCRVRGVDPAATLLATLHRDERMVTARPRSGIWTLTAQGRSQEPEATP